MASSDFLSLAVGSLCHHLEYLVGEKHLGFGNKLDCPSSSVDHVVVKCIDWAIFLKEFQGLSRCDLITPGKSVPGLFKSCFFPFSPSFFFLACSVLGIHLAIVFPIVISGSYPLV